MALLGANGFLVAAENSALIDQFWSATTDSERREIAQQLSSAADVDSLYQLMKQGPEYSADVPIG